MKILILNWRDVKHPLSGGAELSLFEHAKYWQRKKNDIIWFASSFDGAKQKEDIDGITIIRKGSHYTVHLWAALFYLQKKIDPPDIIIDSFHFIPYLSILYAPKKKIIALINEVAGQVWFANLPYIFALCGFYIEPKIIRLYKSIPFITGSNSAKEELFKIGIDKKNIHVVNHGFTKISIPQSMVKEVKPTIIFLARVSLDKGIKDALKAFIQVKRSVKSAQLWVVGKEETVGLMNSLLEEADVKKIKKDIIYYGFVSEKEKFTLLKKAWILVHPSRKEGWGLNVIEAASQGTPTVGYNVGGLQDSVKDGITGILVEPQNNTLLANSMIKLVVGDNKTLYNALSKNAIEWAKNFKWDVSVKKSWDILTRLYEKNQRAKK